MKQKTNAPYTRAKKRFAITAIACLVLSQVSGSITLLPTVEAASSFRPTIFVSTEAFLAIDDDDTTADVVLRFGDTLAKTLIFNRLLDRFEFNDDVHTSGSYTASGTLVTESGAYIDGTSLVVQAASNNVGIGTASPLADLHVVGTETRLDTGTTNGTTTLSFVDNNDEKAHFLLNQATQTFDVQSDGRLSVTSSDYVNVSGTNYTNIQGSTTFIGNNVGIGTTGPKTMLDVAGAISGSFIYATKSFSGAGLTDCDSGTSKLLWDATTGRFSCGTDQAGGGAWSNTGSLQTYFDNRYVNTSGDTMTGALAIQNGTVHTATTTPLINVRGTMSGRLLNVTGSGASALLTTSSGKPTIRIGGSGSLVIEARSTDPGSAPANTSSLFAQKVGGRSMLHQGSGSTFAASPLQNALFGNLIMTLSTGAGTTVNAYGTTATNDTTVSHPAADQTFGYMTNFATAATSGDDAGTSSTNVAYFRGSTAGANGFFYMARVGVVDSTSIRVFSGMADQSITTMVSADNVAGNYAGFQFSTPRLDSNWQFVTKDNTTQNVVNTGMAFTANKVYDLYFTCTKQCASITWEIRNVTDGTSAQGTTSSNLPTASSALRIVLGVESETTAAKNIRMQQIYVEADK